MPYINNAGINIYYEVVGKGTPMVLHHPGGNCVQDWYALGYIGLLKDHYQLILIDARGHGKSDKPHTQEYYSIKSRAEDTIAVMDALKIKQAICFGYSMGGRISFALMYYFPERFTHFIIGGANPYSPTGLMESMKNLLANGITDLVTETEKALGRFPEKVRTNYLENDKNALIAAYSIDWFDLSECLNRISVPCLFYVGSKDPIASKIFQYANLIQNSQVKILSGLNHLQVYWQAPLVTDLIFQFIKI